MKKIVIFSALAAVAVVASAQEQGRVLSATPIIQQVGVPQQVCGNETVYSGNRTTGAGAVIGAIAGGAVGNTIGKGSGRAAATAIGVLGGAVVGNQIEGNGQPQYQNVQRCTTETYYDQRVIGYDVTYEMGGRQYQTRTAQAPGAWIQVPGDPYYGQGGYGGAQTYPVNPPPVAEYPLPSYPAAGEQSGVVTAPPVAYGGYPSPYPAQGYPPPYPAQPYPAPVYRQAYPPPAYPAYPAPVYVRPAPVYVAPVGVNLFVASGVAKAKLEKIAGMALPMIGLMIIVLLICTYIPEVPLCLVGGK